MVVSKIIAGLQILQKYWSSDGYHCGGEHDVLYAYNTDEPVSEEDFGKLVELGWLQESFSDEETHTYAEYDQDMSDKCICGHDHLWQDGQRYEECVEEFCECEEFREQRAEQLDNLAGIS